MQARVMRGFTLLELAIVCAISGLLATVAWPSWRQQWLQAGRADAVQALMRLQGAQAQHHEAHGLYAQQLSALRGASQGISDQGRYSLQLEASDAEGWRASATALPSSPQAADRECLRLTLEVRQGFASVGPTARCWNR
jgi:type IV pilus assembly protein PilE